MKHSDGIFLTGKNINDITEILFGMSDWKWLLYPIVLFYVMPFFFFFLFPKKPFYWYWWSKSDITNSKKSLNDTQWYITSPPLTRLYLLLKYLFGGLKYSRKLWVFPLLIYMIKCPPTMHASEQLMVWNLQTPHGSLWEAQWGGLREPGDLSSLQFLMLALTDGKRALLGWERLPLLPCWPPCSREG